ncbi:MAG: GAF domain-containing protein [Burkholderiaceae bacterium]
MNSLDAETLRLAALAGLNVLDTREDQAYDDLTRLAASRLNAPIALITLVDSDRQWFKSRVGLQVTETPREHSFCAHAIATPDEVFVVGDAKQDPRFAQNPLVVGDPGIRFYAGAPLVTSTGQSVGALCIIDREPRTIDAADIEELRFLARQVMNRLEQDRDEGNDRDDN